MLNPPVPPISVPPTLPGAMRDTQRPRVWPTAIGVIAIVLGSLALLGGLINIGMPYFMGALAGVMPKGVPNPYTAFALWAKPMAASSAVGALVAAILLWGGLLLIKRRPKAVRVIMIWSVLKILYGFGAGAVMAAMQHSMFTTLFEEAKASAARQSGRPPPPFPTDTFAMVMASFTGILFVVWAALLPVFMLIWFTRRSVRADVDAWPAPPFTARTAP